jgi:hypothetical protein
MPKIDYHNTVIYQLTCPTFNDIYVNYTSNLYVRKYGYSHPAKIRKHLEFQDTIDLHGGFENWKIIVLEKYSECKNVADAKKKVEEWIKTLRLPPKTSDLPPECNTCKNCGKKFTRTDNLNRHIKYRCVIENTNIANKRDIIEDITILCEELAKKHEGQRKIIESVCEKIKKQMKKTVIE